MVFFFVFLSLRSRLEARVQDSGPAATPLISEIEMLIVGLSSFSGVIDVNARIVSENKLSILGHRPIYV